MSKNINNIVEFGRVYKRMMDFELCLKAQFKSALMSTYQNKMFYRLIPFLKDNFIGRYTKQSNGKTRDILIDLINSKKREEEKLKIFVEMAYLSDILKFLTDYKTIYQDMLFNKNFYGTKINFNDLKKHSSSIKKLRNTIMHFQVEDYLRNKAKFIEALEYWEHLMTCTNGFMFTLPQVTPTITNIINLLELHYSDFHTSNDRILFDMFDNIADKNGCVPSELPMYKYICDEIYKKKTVRKKIHNHDDEAV